MQVRKIKTVGLSIACALLFCGTILFSGKAKPDDTKPLATTKLKFSPHVPWIGNSWNTRRLVAADHDKSIVDTEVASVIARYEKLEFARANVAEPVKLQTGALTSLFPKHRFYLVGWDEEPVEGKKPVHLAFGLYYAFVIGPQEETTKVQGFGSLEEFGHFLNKNNIKIKSAEDARMVWLAFCDVRQKPWHSRDLRQISTTEWHLGLYQTDNPYWTEQRRYWYRVILDKNKNVTSAKLMFERVKK